jgi:hypothetical protein
MNDETGNNHTHSVGDISDGKVWMNLFPGLEDGDAS